MTAQKPERAVDLAVSRVVAAFPRARSVVLSELQVNVEAAGTIMARAVSCFLCAATCTTGLAYILILRLSVSPDI